MAQVGQRNRLILGTVDLAGQLQGLPVERPGLVQVTKGPGAAFPPR